MQTPSDQTMWLQAVLVLGLAAIVGIVALGLVAMLVGWFRLRAKRGNAQVLVETASAEHQRAAENSEARFNPDN